MKLNNKMFQMSLEYRLQLFNTNPNTTLNILTLTTTLRLTVYQTLNVGMQATFGCYCLS